MGQQSSKWNHCVTCQEAYNKMQLCLVFCFVWILTWHDFHFLLQYTTKILLINVLKYLFNFRMLNVNDNDFLFHSNLIVYVMLVTMLQMDCLVFWVQTYMTNSSDSSDTLMKQKQNYLIDIYSHLFTEVWLKRIWQNCNMTDIWIYVMVF